jgi:hypothetical protein
MLLKMPITFWVWQQDRVLTRLGLGAKILTRIIQAMRTVRERYQQITITVMETNKFCQRTLRNNLHAKICSNLFLKASHQLSWTNFSNQVLLAAWTIKLIRCKIWATSRWCSFKTHSRINNNFLRHKWCKLINKTMVWMDSI